MCVYVHMYNYTRVYIYIYMYERADYCKSPKIALCDSVELNSGGVLICLLNAPQPQAAYP